MFKKVLFAVVITISLGACRDANRTGQEAEVADAAPAATTVAAQPTPVVPVVTDFKGPLAGGVQALPFKYHVAIDREVTAKKTGIKAREIGIEFLDGTVADVDAQVAAEFEKVAYTRAKGEPQGRAIRSLYTKASEPDVLVWVRPGAPRGERYKLQQADAKGTVYMAWNVAPQL